MYLLGGVCTPPPPHLALARGYAKNIGDKMSNLSNTMMIKQQLQVKYSSQARLCCSQVH